MKENKAVAIGYTETEKIPSIIAIAKGKLYKVLIEIAKSKNIAVYQDRDLTELLSKLKSGQSIPEHLFKAVLEVFSYCYRENKKFREKIFKN